MEGVLAGEGPVDARRCCRGRCAGKGVRPEFEEWCSPRPGLPIARGWGCRPGLGQSFLQPILPMSPDRVEDQQRRANVRAQQLAEARIETRVAREAQLALERRLELKEAELTRLRVALREANSEAEAARTAEAELTRLRKAIADAAARRWLRTP